MFKQAESPDREGYKYARFLLHDRQRELQALELKHRRMLILKTDYLSCRRSLLQAIDQLETVLLGDPENFVSKKRSRNHLQKDL